MNYLKYFARGQKVFLINTTPGRDNKIFQAFSATIVSCDNNLFELRPRYSLGDGADSLVAQEMQFKITAESYGVGVQFTGEVSAIRAGGVIAVKPLATMEMYQRAQVPRVDTILDFRYFSRTATLSVFYKEWVKVMNSMSVPGAVERLALAPREINLGAGGIRYLIEPGEQQTDLSMIFLDIKDGLAPVCVVAEQLWKRTLPDSEGIASGRRFVLITKADQERLQKFSTAKLKKLGRKTKLDRTNWELLDRMIYDSEQHKKS
jgi:c-di-GMP-binding flagellar brake protein YcgR